MGTQEYGKIIARNLRRIASDANKSQADIARDLKINKATVSSWMNGTRVPRMDTRDAEHELNVEISENESRKEFSKAERADYMRRLMWIEQAKAKERQTLGEKFPEGGRAGDKTAEQFGISGKTMEAEDHSPALMSARISSLMYPCLLGTVSSFAMMSASVL